MILDQCENWADYAYGKEEVWNAVFSFLSSLEPDCEDGRYEIIGEDVFALVQSYDTKDIADCNIEAHRKFIDIQTLLCGSERMLYAPVNILENCAEYSEDDDVAFYKHEGDKTVEYFLSPGVFTLFLPNEGHMPGIALKTGKEPVKKVVIKIAVGLLA